MAASLDRMMMCQGARTIGEFLSRHPGGRVAVPWVGGPMGLVRRRCDVDLEEGLWTGRICVPQPASVGAIRDMRILVGAEVPTGNREAQGRHRE